MKPNNDEQRIGIVSCSGEEIPEGSISRIATRIVMDTLRPGITTTICLPLFLSGGGNERSFAKRFPTITIDGCSKECARKATTKLSGTPIAALNVEQILAQEGFNKTLSKSKFDANEKEAANIISEKIAEKIDEIQKSS